nr:MAG TPA: adenylation DNA ligase-like protein [Caudoviricetes sp.]
MHLKDRISLLQNYITYIQATDSRNEKEAIINRMVHTVKDDFYYILEILDGKHKLGYTFVNRYNKEVHDIELISKTFRQFIQPLFKPIQNHDLSEAYIYRCCEEVNDYNDFIEPIVNRTLRLGIGRSMLVKDATAPMLAKKYEGTITKDDAYYITEKLDGNRCIAKFVDGQWTFTSRNGKPMHVNFDMSGLDTDFVYDGEVLSPEQTAASIARAQGVFKKMGGDFNTTSGDINKHTLDKKLVYNIFDVQEMWTQYKDRRAVLNTMTPTGDDVRILPILKKYDKSIDPAIYNLLDDVVKSGGEGLMINTSSGLYVPKRTDDLLKVKQVQTIDMRVVDTEFGTGKYELCVGYIYCEATLPNGSKISCKVGTGLSDEQRTRWAMYPMDIIGKIVEVAYFSLSQSKNTYGTTQYSLRFPRLKKVRTDKNETSSY